MDCRHTISHFCDLDVQPKLDLANTAVGEERERRMTELVDIAYDEMIIYTYFNAEVFYGVSRDLIWTPRYDRRPRVNQWSFR